MILVTGVSGFIGKHLLNTLLKTYGHDNILALTSKPINQCKYLLHNNYSFDEDFFIKNGFDKIHTIIHAGAYTPKSNKEANHIEYCNSNILSTTKIITSKLPCLKKVIFLSTLDVYKNNSIISEETEIAPVSLYGYSKLYGEELVLSFAKQKQIKSQILRVGHVYGEGEEKYKKIIPLTMRKLLLGEPLDLYNEGDEIRTFIHVRDIVDNIIKTIKLEENIGVINLVGEDKIQIKNLIKQIISISKTDPIINKVETESTPRNLMFNNSKMKNYLGSPKITLEEGLRLEWNYMKNIPE
jgi:nucleoside-diphosphate-sugar epimerase